MGARVGPSQQRRRSQAFQNKYFGNNYNIYSGWVITKKFRTVGIDVTKCILLHVLLHFLMRKMRARKELESTCLIFTLTNSIARICLAADFLSLPIDTSIYTFAFSRRWLEWQVYLAFCGTYFPSNASVPNKGHRSDRKSARLIHARIRLSRGASNEKSPNATFYILCQPGQTLRNSFH